MLTFPRSAARRIRCLVRKCFMGRPRGPAPPVWIRATTGGVMMVVAVDDVSVGLRFPSATRPETPLLIPMAALEAVEGTNNDPVQIEPQPGQVTLQWTDRGLPRSQRFVVRENPESPQRLALPKILTSMPVRFLQALLEAGRSTAREPQRYALHRVQVRGTAGEVIGTDAHFVVRFEGFTLPFEDEILVPAVPLFALDEFVRAEEARIGRTRQSLVVVAGDVIVWLRLDRDGHYPDVASVIPQTADPTVVTLDDADAIFLLDNLSALPRQDESHRPVTLDLTEGQGLRVRAAGGDTRDVVEVRLPRSLVPTGAQCLAFDRRYLARLLTIGCRTFRVFDHQKPMIATGDAVTTLVMPLETELVVPPTKSARILTPDGPSESLTPRSRLMKSVEPHSNGHAEGEALDPLVEAEALRNALTETLQRLSRLVTALRSRKKEQRALTQVWSSLKSLQLGN